MHATSTQKYKIHSVYEDAVTLIIHCLENVDGIFFLIRACALTNNEEVETPVPSNCADKVQRTISSN